MLTKYGVAAGALALTFGVGFVVGREAPASAQGRNRVFEIRTYVTESKTGLDALVKRMADGEARLFGKAGMTNVGHFVAADAPKSENTYIYIVAHESQEQAKASWAKFREDPEWVKLRASATSPGPIKVDAVFVNPTSFSTMK